MHGGITSIKFISSVSPDTIHWQHWLPMSKEHDSGESPEPRKRGSANFLSCLKRIIILKRAQVWTVLYNLNLKDPAWALIDSTLVNHRTRGSSDLLRWEICSIELLESNQGIKNPVGV
jgi:hypothetical protein